MAEVVEFSKGANTAPKRHSKDFVLQEHDPLYKAQGYAGLGLPFFSHKSPSNGA